MELEIWRQRHKELIEAAERARLARVLRSSRRQRGRASALAWELDRYAGCLRKLVRSLTKRGRERKAASMTCKHPEKRTRSEEGNLTWQKCA